VEWILAALSIKQDSDQERLIACEVPPLKFFFFCMAGGIPALPWLGNGGRCIASCCTLLMFCFNRHAVALTKGFLLHRYPYSVSLSINKLSHF